MFSAYHPVPEAAEETPWVAVGVEGVCMGVSPIRQGRTVGANCIVRRRLIQKARELG